MAYRDYICCRDCKSKFIYDGNDSIRNSLEATYGDEDAPNWTVELVCPNCLARLERNPLTEEEVSNLARTMVKGDKSVNWLCRAIEREHGIVSSQMQHIADLEAALAKPEPPLSTGGWDCSADGKQISHDDFEFDAKLKVSGDFATDEQRIAFAQMVTKTLNGALAQPEPFNPDWDRVKALEESLREHMAEIHRLKALAQPEQEPEQEPVEKISQIALDLHELCGKQALRIELLEKQRKPLTDEEMREVLKTFYFDPNVMFGDVVRAIEKAHGIGVPE